MFPLPIGLPYPFARARWSRAPTQPKCGRSQRGGDTDSSERDGNPIGGERYPHRSCSLYKLTHSYVFCKRRVSWGFPHLFLAQPSIFIDLH